MAVYVILEFTDDEEAKDFVESTIRTDNTVAVYATKETVEAKVDAVIKKPTKFCQCAANGIKRKGWTRGRNFGWWVCSNCGLPSEKWATRDKWFSFMGINLLPPEISTELRPKGWERSKFTWDFLTGAINGK